MPAIGRRQVMAGFALLMPSLALAQMPGYGPAPWRKIPSVAVVWFADDDRVRVVREAVAYWNGLFGEIGTPFRLGTVGYASGLVPADQLKALSDQVLGGGARPDLPAHIDQIAGDIVIALSEGDFISFAMRWPQREKALVAIKTNRRYPLSLPNVERNVVAHELGHAIGLGHNSDPAMLMCGRPAPCRPDLFAGATERFFPLTEAEKAALRAMYPIGRPAR
jgi:hypothetical protein